MAKCEHKHYELAGYPYGLNNIRLQSAYEVFCKDCCNYVNLLTGEIINDKGLVWTRKNLPGLECESMSKKETAIRLIHEAYDAAVVKHPTWPVDHIHAAAILGEEAGEVLQAALDNS